MITIMFTCKGCGIDKRKVTIRDRFPGENIITYTKEAAQAAGDAHSILSPHCHVGKVDLYLPMLNDKGIGYPAPK